MAKSSEPSKEQPYADFLQQRENVKQIIVEHTDSSQFREHNKQLIKEYHSTDEYREKLFKHVDEYHIHRTGSFVKRNSSLIATIIFTAILSSVCTLCVTKLDYNLFQTTLSDIPINQPLLDKNI